MPRLVVLDALCLAYRAYYAFIRRPLLNSRGENTSAIFGFANSVLKVRREENPDYWALAWDGPGPTFRHERYADYKATRKPMPGDLLSQIEPIEHVARALGLAVIELPGMEADDVMATLARRGERDGFDVTLVTSDKDMLQLVDERVSLLSPAGRGDDYVRVDPAAVRERWGVPPGQVRDVLSLMGDSSDNVPGVPGVGEKTAVELIVEFGSLEELYLRVDQVKRPALREKLEIHRELAFLSRELVTVKTDCEIPYAWESLRPGAIRREALLDLARRFELVRLKRVAEQMGVSEAEAGEAAVARPPERQGTAAETPAPGVKLSQPRTPKARANDAPLAPAGSQGALDLWSQMGDRGTPSVALEDNALEARVRALAEESHEGLAILPLWEGEHPRRGRVVGLALAGPGAASCYVPLGHGAGANVEPRRLREWLGAALSNPRTPKFGENLKRDAHLLEGLGVDLALAPDGAVFDVHVLSFLCDPERDHSLEALARDFAGLSVDREPAAPGGRRVRPSALPVEAGMHAGRAAAAIFPVVAALRAQLESRDQWKLYEALERPLLPVLLEMERHGVRLDAGPLHEMSLEAGDEIERLRAELLVLAGETVNLESGPQVAKVLFDTLQLKPRGRTPGGALSTRQDVLEELAGSHPFPARLLEYRALTKLRSTYYDALPEELADDGRVHTVFDQSGAATGRLSSSHPNLQNIPMRSERGRRIRKAFVAPEGAVLVGADYSQIELRVMAHLSGDRSLIAAFEGGEDVHASTARRIFNVGGALDPALRARAKVVNFGIMYGMGARSLAQQMGIARAEAQDFIAHYFRVFEGVRTFLDRTVEEARRRGYVETLLGRRRYLPGLESAHGGERSYTERAAINTPIQGSAADLMKLAMIRVHRALKGRIPSARLLLQVHDELLLECAAADAGAVSDVVRAEMEGCFPLRVPLVVSVGRGPSWFDAH